MRRHCPGCGCPDRWVPIEDVRPLVNELVVRYGSIKQAGRAYAERYGLYIGPTGESSGARLFWRILRKQQRVTMQAADRIRTLVAS